MVGLVAGPTMLDKGDGFVHFGPIHQQAAGAANRLSWKGPSEPARTFPLAITACAGGAVRARFHHQHRRQDRPIL
jgi:hypothetical protein